ncbi:hypothetical protein ACE1B6_00275 [Aerosakkonemataceae cyanobacterium BLCC-F154]|uniref:Uncharacterized protein n=1 Tax=Floridaenema fluviatile BLCC-F154 TaxID=3153640 RepID=A0ABV4Y4P0_9CYAN
MVKIITDQEKIRELAESLYWIRTKEPGRFWFQGKDVYFDVFFKVENEEIVWFQFTWQGNVVSWDKSEPSLKTGVTNEMSYCDRPYPASKTVKFDLYANQELLEFVKAIVKICSIKEPIFAQALNFFN